MQKYDARVCFNAPSQTRRQLADMEKVEGMKRGELLRRLIREAHGKLVEKK